MLAPHRAEDLTKEVSLLSASEVLRPFSEKPSQGMRQGIIESGAVIIFLSAGILSRPFCTCLSSFSLASCLIFAYFFRPVACPIFISPSILQGQFEIRVALASKKVLVLIHESDQRHGAYVSAPAR